MRVLGFPDYERQARRLAQALDAPVDIVALHRFPDGESRVRLPAGLPAHVVLCRSLDRPNDKLVELLLAAATARELGARRLTLVAPYLCYMRQDAAFHPGEAVSQRVIGRFLAGQFDALITVDPHLHRVRRIEEAVPAARAVALTATGLMGEFLAGRVSHPLLVGPDRESEQWVRAIAEPAGLDYAVATKVRRGDREVEVRLPARRYAGEQVVLVDDVASTGETLIAAARALRAAGATSVQVLVTHALFVEDALARLVAEGVADVWSTDSVTHASNAIVLAELLAAAVRAA